MVASEDMRGTTWIDESAALAGTPLGARLRAFAWGAAATLLALPWLAMQLGAQVQWDAADFLVFGAMLLAVCVAVELLLRQPADRWYLGAFGLAVACAFVLLWANLAVGLIGESGHPANAAYGLVSCVGAVGALLSRLRPQGMAWTLLATAIAHAIVVATALIGWRLDADAVLGPNVRFIALWLACAAGFRRGALGAARRQRSA